MAIQNDYFIVELDGKEVRIRCKQTGVVAKVEALATGLSVHGSGEQAYLAHGRDTSFLILDRLSMGMAPLLKLR